MAKKDFLTHIDLHGNQLQNAELYKSWFQNAATVSQPATPVIGQAYYDTTLGKIGVKATAGWTFYYLDTTTLNSITAPTANVSLNSYRITNLADPVGNQDAATKAYVDGISQGLDIKHSVEYASTTQITLSGTQTLDGVSVGPDIRVLVKNQTLPAENGIYITSATAWTRASDVNTWLLLVSAFVFVEKGATLADTGWVCTADPGGTLEATALNWVQFSAAGQITAANIGTGAGTIFRDKVGITINLKSIKAGSNITVTNNADDITLAVSLNTLTIGTGLSGTSYNGSSNVTVAIDSTVATLTGSQIFTNKTLTDSTTYFQDEADNTKKMQFQLSGITASNTRTLTIPDASGTLALISDIYSGSLTLSIGAAGATNTSITVATGTGFTANSTGSTTYQLSIGPAISALTTIMTGATTGYLTKSAADTYVLVTPVTSFSGGSTGLTPNSATTGPIVLAGTLAVGYGGTGATTAAAARTNLGATTKVAFNNTAANIDEYVVYTHNLGTKDVIVQVFEISSGNEVEFEIGRATTNTITLRSNLAYLVDAYRIVIIG